ncbi:hypothetical protein PFISCL1PPCAC_10018, partial [Pristionchus fissidentatus]
PHFAVLVVACRDTTDTSRTGNWHTGSGSLAGILQQSGHCQRPFLYSTDSFLRGSRDSPPPVQRL